MIYGSLAEFVQLNADRNDSALDIGCGIGAYSNVLKEYVRCKKVVTIDAWDKVNPDILIDLEKEDIPFEDNTFDIILMMDFIEHLTKDRGIKILKQAMGIVKKRILLLTPLWWTDNSDNVNDPTLWCYTNVYDLHKSLWLLDDFVEWSRVTINDFDVSGVSNDYFVGIWTKNHNYKQ